MLHWREESSGTPGWLRTVNDRVALRLLIAHGTLTRAQIRDLAGVSKPTASRMVLRLEGAGLTPRWERLQVRAGALP